MKLPIFFTASYFNRPLPLLVLIAALSFTYMLWSGERHIAEQDLDTRFNLQVKGVTERIEQRMRAYEQILHSVRAQFAVHDTVTRQHFHEYINALELARHYPGVQGVGFEPYVSHAQKAAHIAAARRDGYPAYDITPPGEREFYAPVLYIEPFSPRNQRAFGYDRYAEALRRSALNTARDNDETATSGKVRLVIEDDTDAQFGFLMNLPVYRRDKPHDTVAQRQANLIGWITATYRMGDLMQGILGKLETDLDIEVYDGEQISATTLMHDNDGTLSLNDSKAAHQSVQTLQIAGHTWTVLIRSLPSFDAELNQERAHVILFVGIPVSIFLSILVWLLLRSRAQAIAATQTLKQSEARFRNLFNGGNDAIYVSDLKTSKLIEVNEVACRRMGYTHAEFMQMSPMQFNAPNQPDVSEIMKQLVSSGHVLIERIHVTKDGRHLPVEISSHLMEFEGRKIIMSVARDISERKQAEAELRTILQTTADGFWLVSTQTGKLVDVNIAYCNMIGYPREELLNFPIGKVEAEHDEAKIKRNIEALARGEALFFETRHRHKDGHLVDVEVSARFVDVRGGLIVTFIRDITARKLAENQLRQSEERLSIATRAGIIGIWDWDVVNNTLAWDEAMYRLYGISAENFGGAYEAWASALHPEDKARVEQEIQAALRGEREYAPEFRVIWPDGSVHYLKAASHTQFNADGKPLRMIGINIDQTAQKQAALALLDSKAEAEHANRAKSEFLANMSHEIRTPMNAIIGLSELALGMPALQPKLHNYLSKINLSSKALLSIINDILDYSKVEAGRLELDSTEVCLDELLENVADLFNVRAEEKGVEMVLDIAPDVPQHIIGDPLRLGQVLNNLVGNAVKFTERGEIVIKVTQFGLANGVSTLNFTVRDTGIGMTPEQTVRLFNAFTQADSSITRRFGGTGLGLTISKKLVEKMGGEISVNSQLHQGSTFSFTLALPVAGHARIERAPAELHGMRVLVVDDLEISRITLRELLRAWHFEVSEAASGEEALRLIEQRPPDQGFELVLLDWKMPGLSGVEVARRLRASAQHKELNKLPVIIMVTAHSRESLLQEAQGVQLDAVLNKPVTASGLFDTIMDFQGGHRRTPTSPVIELREDTTALRGARILLVEDNETNQLVATDILERLGLTVTVANNGQEALDRLQQSDFEAVLMDLQMPVMDGLEATRRIRQQVRWRELPVIAMTAAVMASDRAACDAAGMNDHIGKPILPNELTRTLLRWVRPACPVVRASGRRSVAAATSATSVWELPGFDVPAALERLGGNDALLRDLLNKFAKEFADAPTMLHSLLQAPDTNEAAALMHRIKGAAANLGARTLQQACDSLEQALKSGSSAIDPTDFNRAMTLTLDSIKALEQATPSSAPANDFACERCNWQHAATLVAQMHTLVQNYEFVPFELIAELKQSVACTPFVDKVRELERALDKTDYNKADEILGALPCIAGHDFCATR